MHQERLFRLAVEAGNLWFRHEPGRGWVLRVQFRRGDEAWDDAYSEQYAGLSTRELLDVIATELDLSL